uniref:uncharacterized protein LOC122580291 n=1 Tax=Erigeron canadensis TaxID=72917 RepID=UPI001CB912A9|nr:uncharacterized protein LOC122580291 [Erigeron canadensis]
METMNNVFELLRMSRDAYVRLTAQFRARRWLKDSKHISVEEKLAIYLFIIGGNQRYSAVKDRFQHSTETINKVFYEVSDAMLEFVKEVIVPTSFSPSLDISGTNRMFDLQKVFKGAVGALDGILIHAVIPADKQHLFKRSDNGKCCQNVLAICDFNMVFTFILAGWEGIADDSQVLSTAISDSDFELLFPPPDKYYLCDTAFRHTRGFMTPYRNVRYSLGGYLDSRATNKKEEFNHAHGKLRNVIECAFGVLKARFPVLMKMISVPFIKQRDIVISCFAIHNFIRTENISDKWFAEYEQEIIFDDKNEYEDDDKDGEDCESEQEDDEEYDDPEDQQFMAKLREDRQFMVNLREEIAGRLMQDRESML